MVSLGADPVRARRPGRRPDLWSIPVVCLAAFLLGPVLSVFLAAAEDSGGLWGHLFQTVLPRYVGNTLVLMAGVGALSLVIGVTTAWAVARYDFPGRSVLEWSLLLPAAMPAYIVAYVYTDFLEFAGPVQQILREIFGWTSKRNYWFPEIRSMGGAILVLTFTLYPYVYVMTRTAFRVTPAAFFEVARVHDRNLFLTVAVPLARPAIAAGVALALMETISDFGTVEYFALETLTLGIFNVWLGMNSLPAAARISSVAFLFVVFLLAIELYGRSRQRFSDTGRRNVGFAPVRIGGWPAAACVMACLLPVAIGFLIPTAILLSFVLRGLSTTDYAAVAAVALNSVSVAFAVAGMVMVAATLMVLVAAHRSSRPLKAAAALSSSGYAFPGTILAIGVVAFGGALDDGIGRLMATLTGFEHQGYLTGGIGLVLIACMIRFQAVGYGAVSAGVSRVPPNMMSASRVLGRGFGASLFKVVLPLIRGSILAGGLLVFVDVMKELPMTLLLRPFDFDTLATHVYQYAKDELLEEAALPALFIVLAGIGPVVLMNAALRTVGNAQRPKSGRLARRRAATTSGGDWPCAGQARVQRLDGNS